MVSEHTTDHAMNDKFILEKIYIDMRLRHRQYLWRQYIGSHSRMRIQCSMLFISVPLRNIHTFVHADSLCLCRTERPIKNKVEQIAKQRQQQTKTFRSISSLAKYYYQKLMIKKDEMTQYDKNINVYLFLFSTTNRARMIFFQCHICA